MGHYPFVATRDAQNYYLFWSNQQTVGHIFTGQTTSAQTYTDAGVHVFKVTNDDAWDALRAAYTPA